jgi:hypothetical protein
VKNPRQNRRGACIILYTKNEMPSLLLQEEKNMLYKVSSRYTAKFLAGHYDRKMSSIGTVPSYNCP